MVALVVLAVVLVAPGPVFSGDVLVVAKSGKLTVKGSDGPDVLNLAGVGQDLQVTPGAGTTVNGNGAPVSFTVTGAITVDLGAGDDAITFDATPIESNLNVKLGAGFDAFRLESSNVGGKLALDLGPGTATVALCDAGILGSVTVKGGPAGPGLADTGCVGVDNAAAAATNGTAIVLGNSSTAGNFAVKLKTGDATVRMANSGAVGKASFTFGDGATLLGLCDAGIGESLTVKMKNGGPGGSHTCTIGSSTVVSNLAHSVILFGTQIDGSVSLKGGKGIDGVTLNNTAIGEELKVALSDGTNIVGAIDAVVGASLTMTGGKGIDLVSAPSLTVGERAKLSVGKGNNLVTLGTSIIGENLTIKAGDGDDVITTDQTTVGGKKTIKPGGGTNSVQ